MRRYLVITLLLLSSATIFAQNCPPNIDFEGGTFTNWQCLTGKTVVVANQNVINLAPSSPTPGRHEIISAATNMADPYGKFPTLCPYGGDYSVKLGNTGIGAEAEGLSYTFQIPPLADTFSLTYYYAVVFEDPDHATFEQPRFFVTAYEVATGALINCASYNYVSTSSLPGFFESEVDRNVLYRNWTPASIDFSGLAGKMVRLEFKTADCTLGGHFGYAYVDVGTGCGGEIAAAALCGPTNVVQLNAPYGFKNYTWYNANYSVVVGTQQNVTITPPPPANTMFHVDMEPYPGFGCRDTADARVTALPVPDTPVARSDYQYCQFQVPARLTATARNGYDLLWYTTPTGGTPANQPILPSTANAGIIKYYVSQKKPFSCESPRKEIRVEVYPTPIISFAANSSTQCLIGNNFIFKNTSTNLTDSSKYLWDFGDGKTSALAEPSHIYTQAGNYTVRLSISNPYSCSRDLSKIVTVASNPIAKATYPAIACEQQTQIILNDVSTLPGSVGIINNWQWFVGGNILSGSSPSPFVAAPGALQVRQVVRSNEGCYSDTNTFTIPVHYRPTVKFKHSLLCSNETITFSDQSVLPPAAAPDYVSQWNWDFVGHATSTIKTPALNLPAGVHHVKFHSQSNVGCTGLVLDSLITVHEKPEVTLSISDSCIRRVVEYSGTSTGSIPVARWFWDFGTSVQLGTQKMTKRYPAPVDIPLRMIGASSHGCKDTVIRPFSIYKNHVIPKKEVIAALGQPVDLFMGGDAGYQYTWTPPAGLTNAFTGNPKALLDRDQLYELNSLSAEGCDMRSTFLVKRYVGPDILIPTAFTPNGDGNNDVLKVLPVGVSSFSYFAVYNRFGVRLFHTADFSRGWDGTYNGAKVDPGAFVFEAKAISYDGKPIVKTGSVVLIR